MGFVFAFPIERVIQYSFESAPNLPGSTYTTSNYSLAVQDPNFFPAIRHNLTLLLAVPVLTALALLFAVLVFKQTRASNFYRSAMFLPYVLSIPIVGVTFGFIYSLNGPFNAALRSVGLGALAHDWLGSPSLAIGAVLTVIVWKEFGFGLILFSARMSTIDHELYDAARVDGAGWWSQHRHVTLPALAQVIQFFVVVEAITMLAFVFGYVYTMTHGGPGGATVVMEFQIWEQGFASGDTGLASATAVILLGGIVLVLLTLILLRAAVRRALR
jgi:ABC-type sugar transport system permease subunit